MRFLILALFFSTFHCNIEGFLLDINSSDKTNVTSNKEYKSKKRTGISFYDNTSVGEVLDEIDGIKVYFNGPITNVNGRNVTRDGYNLGLKFQCVEFVKRYYYEKYDHRMPNSYGHAKEFFDKSIAGKGINRARALRQYSNGGTTMPMKGDLIVFDASPHNNFGHVGIVSRVSGGSVELVQQNVAKYTRATYNLLSNSGHYYIDDPYILGWLRY